MSTMRAHGLRSTAASRRRSRRARLVGVPVARVSGLVTSSKTSRRGREREHAGEQEEHVAPAEQVAEDAAGGLAEHLAENLARQVAAEHRAGAARRA